jgi:peptide/nickel transport system ATP-binding protein
LASPRGYIKVRSKPLLYIDNVTKRFGYGFLGRVSFPAVDKVSLALHYEPTILTIAGESGCGKTTLARMIIGIVEPSEGFVRYKDKDIHKLKSKELLWFRREVQAIFQDPYETFNPMKRVETYLYESAKNLLGKKDLNQAFEVIDNSLQSVGLSLGDIRDKYPTEFSGGQLQRISIARALLSQPTLIVADEPVSMIDASMRMNIINVFKELKERHGISFIYITHDLATAYYVSDEIAIMYRGMIVEKGSAEKVLVGQHHPYTRAMVTSLPEPHKRETWLRVSEAKPTEIEIREFLARGCKYANMCPHKFDKCSQRPPVFSVDGVEVSCWLYE